MCPIDFRWLWGVTFKVICLLQSFSRVIFFEQMCSCWQDFIWHSASRGASAIAELLAHFCTENEIWNDVQWWTSVFHYFTRFYRIGTHQWDRTIISNNSPISMVYTRTRVDRPCSVFCRQGPWTRMSFWTPMLNLSGRVHRRHFYTLFAVPPYGQPIG